MSDGLIYGIICVTFVATTFWLSAVFEGRRREREQKIQQILEEASDPRAVVRVLASVRGTSLMVHENALMGNTFAVTLYSFSFDPYDYRDASFTGS